LLDTAGEAVAIFEGDLVCKPDVGYKKTRVQRAGQFHKSELLLCQRWLGRTSQGGQEDGALAGGVRTEEANDLVVVEGEPGGAEAERVGRQVHLASKNSRFELRGAITAIAEAAEQAFEIGEKEDRHGRIAGEPLLEREERGTVAEVAEVEDLQTALGDV